MHSNRVEDVQITHNGIVLHGLLGCPVGAQGIVVFAHGSGSGRLSPRNQAVARHFRDQGLATLLLDLLTEDEEDLDLKTSELRFNIDFLSKRLLLATEWVSRHELCGNLGIGYFGASTGAAAALVAAAMRPDLVQALVSRGGRPDLAADFLQEVRAPTLLIVGSIDHIVLTMNREAMQKMTQAQCRLEIVPGATHLFEEPGTLAQVADLAEKWLSGLLHSTQTEVSHHL